MSKYSQMNDHGDVIIDMESLVKAQKNAKNEQSTKRLKETQSIQTSNDHSRMIWRVLKMALLAVTAFIVCNNYCFDQQSMNKTQRKLKTFATGQMEVFEEHLFHLIGKDKPKSTESGKIKGKLTHQDCRYYANLDRVDPESVRKTFTEDRVQYFELDQDMMALIKELKGQSAPDITKHHNIPELSQKLKQLVVEHFEQSGLLKGFKDDEYKFEVIGPVVRATEQRAHKVITQPHVDWRSLEQAKQAIAKGAVDGQEPVRHDFDEYELMQIVNVWLPFIDVDKNWPLVFLKEGTTMDKPIYEYKPMKFGEGILFDPLTKVHGSPGIENGLRVSGEWRIILLKKTSVQMPLKQTKAGGLMDLMEKTKMFDEEKQKELSRLRDTLVQQERKAKLVTQYHEEQERMATLVHEGQERRTTLMHEQQEREAALMRKEERTSHEASARQKSKRLRMVMGIGCVFLLAVVCAFQSMK